MGRGQEKEKRGSRVSTEEDPRCIHPRERTSTGPLRAAFPLPGTIVRLHEDAGDRKDSSVQLRPMSVSDDWERGTVQLLV